ncbi:MAG: hypothetical protein U1D30_02085 [Planctomycetota bacterium]
MPKKQGHAVTPRLKPRKAANSVPYWLSLVLCLTYSSTSWPEAEPLTPPVSPLPAAAPANKPVDLNAGPFLLQTEPFVRAPRADELIPLGVELEARGMPDAAKSVYASLGTNATELAPLVERSLQLGQFAAAEAILGKWRRKNPRDPKAAILAIVLWYGQGQAELAMREISASRDLVAADDQSLLQLLSDLCKQSLRGGIPGVEENPWGIRFVGADGNFQAGAIAPQELQKLPPGADQAILRLVTLVPKQGNLWGLAAEVLNARGDTASALVCMKRAEALLYTPRLLRDHRRVLESTQRRRSKKRRKRWTRPWVSLARRLQCFAGANRNAVRLGSTCGTAEDFRRGDPGRIVHALDRRSTNP